MPIDMTTTYPFRTQRFNEIGAIYVITNSQKQVIYIGQTGNLDTRIEQHRNDTAHKMHRYAPALIVVEVEASELRRLVRERTLIAEYSPPAND